MDEITKQIEYLSLIQRGREAADARRKVWADVCVTLQAHLDHICKKLSLGVPAYNPCAIPPGPQVTQTLYLSLGNMPTGLKRGPNAFSLEKGAQLELHLDPSGIVNANYHGATIDDERNTSCVSLARFEPSDAMTKIDAIVTEFLRRAAEDHWSRVPDVGS